MKQFIKLHVYIFLLFAIFEILSCSKNQDSGIIPNYIGKWERTWEDTNSGTVQLMKQNLELKTENFTSTILKNNNNNWDTTIEVIGKYSVIENIVKVEILKLGKFIGLSKMTYYEPNETSFQEILSTDLKIGKNFIGLQQVVNDQLTLHLDYNGDSIVGDEGALIFTKIK